jgi:hypothetical protein
MTMTGGCRCGSVRYEANGAPLHHAICHCNDCRRSAGAPMVGWIAFPADQVQLTEGDTAIYASSPGVTRHFCIQCGTGLFYFNEAVLPGLVDIQSATLDEADKQAPGAQIQAAERLPWVPGLAEIPAFERYPPMPE